MMEPKYSYHHLKLLLLLLLLPGVPILTAATGIQEIMELPALGNIFDLGYLYNAQKNQFLSSGFISELPINSTEIIDSPYTDLKMSITNTLEQKFNLLQINAQIKASILSGLIKVSGGASYLSKENINSHEVSGNFILHTKTVVESVNIFYEKFKPFLQLDLLNQTEATHIITRISWGANVAISFVDSNSAKEDKKTVSGRLELSFDKLKAFLSISGEADANITDKGYTNTSTYTITVQGDVKLPNLIPTSYKNIVELIQKIPESIRSTNGGKGVPISYTLTPIKAILDHLIATQKLHSSKLKLPNVVYQLDEISLTECTNMFEHISVTQQKLNDFKEELDDYHSCALPETADKLIILTQNFTISKLQFMRTLREAIVKERSGSSSNQFNLSMVAQGYSSNKFSPFGTVQKLNELKRYNYESRKIDICQVFIPAVSSVDDIEYFGSGKNNLDQRLIELTNVDIYVFFIKPIFMQDYKNLWFETYNTFSTILNQTYNKRFIVDCRFFYNKCKSIDRPCIQQVRNGVVVVNDVHKQLNFTESKILPMKALGQFAKFGELYHAGTDSFLKNSILPQFFPTEFINSQRRYSSETNYIESESFSSKFKALGVDLNQQFFILGGINPKLTRSGKYFQESPIYDLKKGAQIRSVVHTVILKEEEINLTATDFAKSIQTDKINRFKATHFVSKIWFGFNFIFSVKSQTFSLNETTTESEILDVTRQLKEVIESCAVTNNSPNPPATVNISNLDGKYKIQIFSDIEEYHSKATILESNVQLQNYLNNEFSLQQKLQNNGTGQPVAYELYPVTNFQSKFGIFTNATLYTLATETNVFPSEIEAIFDQVADASSQIEELSLEMQARCNQTTDENYSSMRKIKEKFKTTLGSFKEQLSNKLKNIFSKQEDVGKLKECLNNFQSKNFFGDGPQYTELERLSLYRKKLTFYYWIVNYATYLGRKSEFEWITFITNKDAFQNCVFLVFKSEWMETCSEKWRLSSWISYEAANDTNIFVVDCDFHHPLCQNITQPSILTLDTNTGIIVPTGQPWHFKSKEVKSFVLASGQNANQNKIDSASTAYSSVLEKDNASESLLHVLAISSIPAAFVLILIFKFVRRKQFYLQLKSKEEKSSLPLNRIIDT